MRAGRAVTLAHLRRTYSSEDVITSLEAEDPTQAWTTWPICFSPFDMWTAVYLRENACGSALSCDVVIDQLAYLLASQSRGKARALSDVVTNSSSLSMLFGTWANICGKEYLNLLLIESILSGTCA